MARRREAAVDRHDLGDFAQAGCPRQDGRPVEGWDVPPGGIVGLHADRAAGEDDRDAGHQPTP